MRSSNFSLLLQCRAGRGKMINSLFFNVTYSATIGLLFLYRNIGQNVVKAYMISDAADRQTLALPLLYSAELTCGPSSELYFCRQCQPHERF
jgi:hypothetical protein